MTDEDGASTLKVCEMLGASEKDAHRSVLELVRRGRLFKAARRGFRARWFATEAAAQHWESLPAGDNSEMRPRPGRTPQAEAAREAARLAREERARQRMEAQRAEKPKSAPKKVKNVPAIRVKPGNDAPVTLHSKPGDIRGAVDYSKAKITICPAPKFNYRHEYAPGSEAWTGFAKEWKQLRGAA